MTDYLTRRGFTPETIADVGWRVERIGNRCKRYGLPAAAADLDAWFIPYPGQDGAVAFERLRLLDGDVERIGGGKYRQPAGSPLALYDPYLWLSPKRPPYDSLLLVEGEANAVSVAQLLPQLPVAGLPGHNALTDDVVGQLAHIPVVWVWMDLHEKGAARALRAAIRRLHAAGVDDVRPIEGAAGEDANEILCEFKLPARVVRSLLDRAQTAIREHVEDGKAPRGPRLTYLDVEQLHRTEPRPVPWIVDGLAVRGSLTMLAGQPGEGKSLLALAVASGVARGETVAGMYCRQGRVLIVDAEQSQGEIHRRVRALELPPDRVDICLVDGIDLARDLATIRAEVDRLSPDLVILDSWRSMWTGDENDSGRAGPVLYDVNRLAQNYGAAIVLLHHAGKGEAPYRGSTAIGGAVELGFTLGREKGDDDPLRRHLFCWKCRPALEPPRRWLRIEDDRQHNRLFIEAAKAFEGPDRSGRPAHAAADAQDQILRLLADGPLNQGDVAGGGGGGPPTGPSAASWKRSNTPAR